MWESANIRVHLTGKAAVTIGTQPQGQGHETTVSQIVADQLGIPIEDVTVELGDTLEHAVRLRHLREPERRGRRDRRLQQRPEDQGQGTAHRRAHARGAPRRHRLRGRQGVRQGRSGEREDDPGDRGCGRARVRPARGRGAVPRRHDLLRPAELHVPVRDARRGGRDRRRDGRGDAHALRRGGRRRQGHQPDDRRRPGARRHRAGHRAGALGRQRLRRERPARRRRA